MNRRTATHPHPHRHARIPDAAAVAVSPDAGATPPATASSAPDQHPVSTVWVCMTPSGAPPVASPAAVRALVRRYTNPGARVLLIEPPVVRSRARTQRLAAQLQQLGRQVTTAPPPSPPPARHHSATAPDPARSDLAAAKPAATPRPTFDLIVTSTDPELARPTPVGAWATQLAPRGVLILLTRGRHRGGVLIEADPALIRAAKRAGLVLADRLILLHDRPHAPGKTTPAQRDLVLLGGHRRIHSTALVFTCGGAA